jgi:MYXO-CTERM domain-containing protein
MLFNKTLLTGFITLCLSMPLLASAGVIIVVGQEGPDGQSPDEEIHTMFNQHLTNDEDSDDETHEDCEYSFAIYDGVTVLLKWQADDANGEKKPEVVQVGNEGHYGDLQAGLSALGLAAHEMEIEDYSKVDTLLGSIFYIIEIDTTDEKQTVHGASGCAISTTDSEANHTHPFWILTLLGLVLFTSRRRN